MDCWPEVFHDLDQNVDYSQGPSCLCYKSCSELSNQGTSITSYINTPNITAAMCVRVAGQVLLMLAY